MTARQLQTNNVLLGLVSRMRVFPSSRYRGTQEMKNQGQGGDGGRQIKFREAMTYLLHPLITSHTQRQYMRARARARRTLCTRT